MGEAIVRIEGSQVPIVVRINVQRPTFRLAGGTILALEIKGTDSPQNKAKRDALNEWVKATNAAGGFGGWAWDVAFKPGEVHDIITKHTAVAEPAE